MAQYDEKKVIARYVEKSINKVWYYDKNELYNS